MFLISIHTLSLTHIGQKKRRTPKCHVISLKYFTLMHFTLRNMYGFWQYAKCSSVIVILRSGFCLAVYYVCVRVCVVFVTRHHFHWNGIKFMAYNHKRYSIFYSLVNVVWSQHTICQKCQSISFHFIYKFHKTKRKEQPKVVNCKMYMCVTWSVTLNVSSESTYKCVISICIIQMVFTSNRLET